MEKEVKSSVESIAKEIELIRSQTDDKWKAVVSQLEQEIKDLKEIMIE